MISFDKNKIYNRDRHEERLLWNTSENNGDLFPFFLSIE